MSAELCELNVQLEGSPVIPGSLHSHRVERDYSCHIWPFLSISGVAPTTGSGGCEKLGVRAPTAQLPVLSIMVYRNSWLTAAGKAPLDLFWVTGIQVPWKKKQSHSNKRGDAVRAMPCSPGALSLPGCDSS